MRPPEALFERFRCRGDAAALGQLFDQLAPELLVIASHLARDLAEAEDLVGSTFLAAIESAHRYDAARPLVPWFVGILVNKARAQRLSTARAPDPERLHERIARTPEELACEAELRLALERGIRALEPPYREVVAAHLLAGKAPREIAVDVARAPGTVRVQLHRGLDLLRKALPAGLATGLVVQLLPTRGLAAVRETVVETATRQIAGRDTALDANPDTTHADAQGPPPELSASSAMPVGAVLIVGLVIVALGTVLLRARDLSLPTESRALAARPAMALDMDAAQPASSGLRDGRSTGRQEVAPTAERRALDSRVDVLPEPEPEASVVATPRLDPIARVRVDAADIPLHSSHLPGHVRIAARVGTANVSDPLGTIAEVEGSVELGGTIELDLAPFVAGGVPPACLHVTYDHPGLQPWHAVTPVDLAREATDGARKVVAIHARPLAPCVCAVGDAGEADEVVLVRSVLNGSDGAPLEILDHHRGPGAFTLRVPEPGLFAAVWLDEGRSPTWVEFTAERSGTALVLPPSTRAASAPFSVALARDVDWFDGTVRVRLFAPEFTEHLASRPSGPDDLLVPEAVALLWVAAHELELEARAPAPRRRTSPGRMSKGRAVVYAVQEQVLRNGSEAVFAPPHSERCSYSIEHPLAAGTFCVPMPVPRSARQRLALELPVCLVEVSATVAERSAAGLEATVEAEYGTDLDHLEHALRGGFEDYVWPVGSSPLEDQGGASCRFRHRVTLDVAGRASLLAPSDVELHITLEGAAAARDVVTGRAMRRVRASLSASSEDR